ncbi:MAG: 2-C-methyl-D-erythritol 4-phosphate cytidylyltransferase [bacterium]
MTEAIIVAAGRSSRTKRDKLYFPLKGKPLIFWTIEAILNEVSSIILVVSKERLDWWKENNIFGIKKIAIGGKERQDSVYNGLKMLSEDTKIVLIHDGARPFVSKELIGRVISCAKNDGAAVPGIPSKATVKMVKDGWVLNTLNRENLWLIQTPQGFKKEIILSSYKKAYESGFYGTDCASLVEKAGFKVKIVLGDERNIKITTPFDLELAKVIIRLLFSPL